MKQPKREPVAVINSLIALVEAIGALAIGLGLQLSKEEMGGVAPVPWTGKDWAAHAAA